jgi:ribosomal protein L5
LLRLRTLLSYAPTGLKWRSTRTRFQGEERGLNYLLCQSAKRRPLISRVSIFLLVPSSASPIADLEQLLHLLSDGSRPAGQMVRCTKARAMFAMRACRKSVMIGKTLTKNQMVALLRNMGTIDQPWVCLLLLLRDNEGLMSRIVHMVDRLCDI